MDSRIQKTWLKIFAFLGLTHGKSPSRLPRSYNQRERYRNIAQDEGRRPYRGLFGTSEFSNFRKLVLIPCLTSRKNFAIQSRFLSFQEFAPKLWSIDVRLFCEIRRDLLIKFLHVSKVDEGGETEQIILKLSSETTVMLFKIMRHTPLHMLMKAYCDRVVSTALLLTLKTFDKRSLLFQGKSMQKARFIFKDSRIRENDTATTLKMVEGDNIEVYQCCCWMNKFRKLVGDGRIIKR